MALVYLGLGSNEGDRLAFLTFGIENIKKEIGVIQKSSSIYQTAPWGFTSENDFYNMVLAVKTELTIEKLFEACKHIEKNAGRKPILGETHFKNRPLDIDILFYDSEIIDHQKIKIPHKEIEKRNFVLVPLHEIAPDFVHPILNKKIKELLDDSQDKLAVLKIELPN